jgi:hypothetical protein
MASHRFNSLDDADHDTIGFLGREGCWDRRGNDTLPLVGQHGQ